MLGIGCGSLGLQVSFTGEARWYILISTLPFSILGLFLFVFRFGVRQRTERLMIEDKQFFDQEWVSGRRCWPAPLLPRS